MASKTTYGCDCGYRTQYDFEPGQPRPFGMPCPICGRDMTRVAEIDVQPNNDDDMKRVSVASEMLKFGSMVSKSKVVF